MEYVWITVYLKFFLIAKQYFLLRSLDTEILPIIFCSVSIGQTTDLVISINYFVCDRNHKIQINSFYKELITNS